VVTFLALIGFAGQHWFPAAAAIVAVAPNPTAATVVAAAPSCQRRLLPVPRPL